MKKLPFLIFATLLLFFGLAAESFAQSRGINDRQRRQQSRIYNGVNSGELTRREAYRLQRNQYRINRTEQRFRRTGGRLTRRERYILDRRQDRASRRIYRQKHDRQDRL